MNTSLDLLKKLAKSFGPATEKLASVVLDDPRFVDWSGSTRKDTHHYGRGQLAQHTLEVAELALLNNQYFHTIGKSVNSEWLFLACLFHDAGKMWDYAPTSEELTDWTNTPHKKKIYHISRSAIVWSKAFDQHGSHLPVEAHDEVLHGILAHHGRREWGSPVEPQNRLGYLVHLADMLSARIDDCELPKLTHEHDKR